MLLEMSLLLTPVNWEDSSIIMYDDDDNDVRIISLYMCELQNNEIICRWHFLNLAWYAFVKHIFQHFHHITEGNG